MKCFTQGASIRRYTTENGNTGATKKFKETRHRKEDCMLQLLKYCIPIEIEKPKHLEAEADSLTVLNILNTFIKLPCCASERAD